MLTDVLNSPVDPLIGLLKKAPAGAVFNPWRQVDRQNDIGRQAPRIRREQLRAYLVSRLNTARWAVIGEALGYRGGHFSGIPMVSERILLEKVHSIIPGLLPRRTSKPETNRHGFSEPTATIIWRTFLELGLQPERFVLWNAFPWHSFHARCGMLSNRTPTSSERRLGLPILEAFLSLFDRPQVVALGRIAASQLTAAGISAPCVRHPASGGARLFRQQIATILPGSPQSR
jgi:uracil-DNA glycosylase